MKLRVLLLAALAFAVAVPDAAIAAPAGPEAEPREEGCIIWEPYTNVATDNCTEPPG